MKFDYGKFWRMGNGNARGALVVITDTGFRMGGHDIWKLIKGDLRPEQPIVFRYQMGSQPKDLIATTYPPRYLLSEGVVHALTENRFTGWSTYPVRLFGKGDKEIRGYHGFAITGKAGPPDRSRSQQVELPFRGRTMSHRKGVYFDEKTWDGSDIFLIEKTGYICVAEAVREAIRRLNPTNIEFERLSEILAPT